MVDDYNILVIFLPLLLSSNLFHLVSATGDTISPNQSIADGQTLISSDGSFALGIFTTPAGSKNRYAGIWFNNIPLQTVVWVANRATPITGSGGVLHLTADGNLIVQDDASVVLWSTATSGFTAQLLDSGNLVVLNESKGILWQSFDHPSDTLLPEMKLGWDLRTHLDRRLVSWKTTSDPSPGTYSLAMDLRGSPEMYMWNGSVPRSRSGPWDGESLGGAAPMKHNDLFTFRFVANDDEVYYAYETLNQSVKARLVVTQLGFVQRLLWIGEEWKAYWSEPADRCSEYGQCGAYGVCDSGEYPICKCLIGYVPKSTENWNVMEDWSGGCVRRTELSCPEGDGDGFLKVTVKLPDTSNATVGKDLGLDECRDGCWKKCSCTAFAFLGSGSGCIAWHGDLIDIRELSLGGGDDLYVRLAASELPTDIVKELLNALPELSMTVDLSNTTALHTAATQGHNEVVNLLLEADGSLALIARSNGKTALHSAARNGHLEVVKALLNKEPGISTRTDKKRQTALHMAVKGTSLELVEELLKFESALANLVDTKGNTTLHIANDFIFFLPVMFLSVFISIIYFIVVLPMIHGYFYR